MEIYNKLFKQKWIGTIRMEETIFIILYILNVVLYLGKDLIRTKGQILQEISGI